MQSTDKTKRPSREGILGVMLALFLFAAIVAAGAYLVKPGSEDFTLTANYWTTLKAAIIIACMVGFLGFWGMMLGIRHLRAGSK